MLHSVFIIIFVLQTSSVLTSNDRMSAITIFSLYLEKNQYVTDHLNEEGLAELEEIEIRFSIIFLFSILLIISYGIHLNRHFYVFRLLARILFQTYDIWTIIQDALDHQTLPRVETDQ